jgi:hypothetical protein
MVAKPLAVLFVQSLLALMHFGWFVASVVLAIAAALLAIYVRIWWYPAGGGR